MICPGRADTLDETPFQTARREAWEEIGLPEINQRLPRPFRVEHICELPANLAKTELVVRPCVALLHSYDEQTGENADPEVSLIPELDAREVAAVFTAPFHNFLRIHPPDQTGVADNDDEWYQGLWTWWHESNWRSKFLSFLFFSGQAASPWIHMAAKAWYIHTYIHTTIVHSIEEKGWACCQTLRPTQACLLELKG